MQHPRQAGGDSSTAVAGAAADNTEESASLQYAIFECGAVTVANVPIRCFLSNIGCFLLITKMKTAGPSYRYEQQ